jgi:FkbM family methyltransferase
VEWALANTKGFHVGASKKLTALKVFEEALPKIIGAMRTSGDDNRAEQPIVLFDIGGAEYGGGSDKSDASVMLEAFAGSKQKVEIHAFDMQEATLARTREALLKRHGAEAMKQVALHTMGISSASGVGIVCKNNWHNQWFLASGERPCEKDNVESEVPMKSLADFCKENAIQNVAYVKVDVEGGENSVFEGMKDLMSSGRVQFASFEYALNWDALFKLDDHTQTREKLGLSAKCTTDKNMCWGEEARAFEKLANATSLSRFAGKLSDIGWDTYLLHKNESVTLVPIHGPFWDPIFEIGLHFNDPPFQHPWHWTDLLAVRAADTAAKESLFRTFPSPLAACESGSY